MKIKGFDKNLCCRGMQFEIGKVYDTGAKDDEVMLCSGTVFHYCNSIRDVHCFYDCCPDEENRFCEIEVLGAEVSDNVKCGSNRIRIVREIVGNELNAMIGLTNGNTGLLNSGDRNSGNNNSGNRNSGNWNSGNYNSGNYNSGNRNSGNWNSCASSNGVFCNEPDRNIRIFNQPSGMSLEEFRNSFYYDALASKPFPLTWWDEETKTLKTRSYKEACAIWWEALTKENKEIIQQIPNFDADVFFDITGIRVKED